MGSANLLKISSVIFFLTAFTFAAASQSLQKADSAENDVIWLNSDKSFDEVKAVCDSSIDNVTVGDRGIYQDSDQERMLRTDDFPDNISLGSQEVTLNCGDSNSESQSFNFAKFEITGVKQAGEGFVGGKMSPGIEIGYNLTEKDEAFDAGSFEYELSNGLEVGQGSFSFDDERITLNPYIESYPKGLKSELTVKRDGYKKAYQLNDDLPPKDLFVHQWRVEGVSDSNPGRVLNYQEVIAGNYEYLLDVSFIPDKDNVEMLENTNFVLEVSKKVPYGKESEYPGYDQGDYRPVDFEENGVGDDGNGLRIFDDDEPVSGSGNYRVFIEDYSELNDLGPGTYRFDFNVRYEPVGDGLDEDEVFEINTTRIDKEEGFVGVVTDSGGNGVVSEMFLEGSDSEQSFTTDSDGAYSTSLEESVYDVKASFFATSGETSSPPDVTYSLSNVDLSKADLRPGASPVRFDYQEDPQVNIEGLRPVNLAMMKFAYPIGGVDNLDIAFNSGELNPKDLQVFECSSWIFEASSCSGSWEQVDEEDLTRNAAPSFTAGINDVDLYDIEGDSILMNAYVIGTNSEINLQSSLDIPNLRVKQGGRFEASGTLVDEDNDRVENAEVELSFIGTDRELNTTTDNTGTFDLSGDLDLEKGNYQLRLEASKPPYESLEIESNETIEVYKMKDISVDAQSDPVIPPGEEYDITYTVTNSGQTALNDVTVDVSGVQRDKYTLSTQRIDSLEPEETSEIILTLDPPEEFQTPPAIDFVATGTAEGEEVTASANTLVTFDDSGETQDEESNESQNDSKNVNGTGTDDNAVQQLSQFTGEFVESQSDMNLALGLILVFAAILAVAVKKRNDEGDGRRGRDGRGGDRGRPVQSAQISPTQVKPSEEEDSAQPVQENGDEDDEEVEGSEDEQDAGEDEEDLEKCDTCGETFDTESGLKLHREAIH